MGDIAKLKAAPVPFSSVVGSGIMFTNEAGAAVINLAVMVPSPSFDYREHADPFVKRLIKLWNEARND